MSGVEKPESEERAHYLAVVLRRVCIQLSILLIVPETVVANLPFDLLIGIALLF